MFLAYRTTLLLRVSGFSESLKTLDEFYNALAGSFTRQDYTDSGIGGYFIASCAPEYFTDGVSNGSSESSAILTGAKEPDKMIKTAEKIQPVMLEYARHCVEISGLKEIVIGDELFDPQRFVHYNHLLTAIAILDNRPVPNAPYLVWDGLGRFESYPTESMHMQILAHPEDWALIPVVMDTV